MLFYMSIAVQQISAHIGLNDFKLLVFLKAKREISLLANMACLHCMQEVHGLRRGGTNEAHAVVSHGWHGDSEERNCIPGAPCGDHDVRS